MDIFNPNEDDFEDEEPDLSKMTYEEFLMWLYENRDILFEELDELEEFNAHLHTVVHVKVNDKINTIGDQYGPFLTFRN